MSAKSINQKTTPKSSELSIENKQKSKTQNDILLPVRILSCSCLSITLSHHTSVIIIYNDWALGFEEASFGLNIIFIGLEI